MRRAYLPIAFLFLCLLASCTKFRPRVNDVFDTTNVVDCTSDEQCSEFESECAESFCDTFQGICAFQPKPGFCFVDGLCFTTGANPVDDYCVTCQPELSQAELFPRECPPGTGCSNETSSCAALTDVPDFSDVCPDGDCGDTVSCPGLGCCEGAPDCPEVPGICSSSACLEGFCQEAPAVADCLLILNSPSGCTADSALQNGSDGSEVAWTFEQPENDPGKLWQFITDQKGISFTQSVPNSGAQATAIGPIFWVSTPCSGGQIQVQVEHQGEITGAIPHIKVRALDSLDWVDLGTLPPHNNDFAAPRLSTFSTPLGFLAPKFQVAIQSDLSAVPPCCQVEAYNIRVDSGSPPSWDEEFPQITVPAAATSTFEIFASDPDGDELFFYDVTAPDGTGIENIYSLESPITNDAGKTGVRVTFHQPPASVFQIALEVRDQDGQNGLGHRSFLTVQVQASTACGNLILEEEEECDLGENAPEELCLACTAPEIEVDTGPFGSIYDTRVSRFPVLGSGRVAMTWRAQAPDTSQEIFFRLLDTNVTSSDDDIFLTDSVSVATTTTATAVYNVDVAALSQSLLAVAWEEHQGGDQNLRYRVFNEQGNSVAGTAVFTPYPQASSPRYTTPTVARVDGTRVAVAWIEEVPVEGASGDVRGRLLANVISVPAQLAIPNSPSMLWDSENHSVTAIAITKRNTNELWIVWAERSLGEGSTRIRATAVDASSFTVTVPELIVQESPSGIVGAPSIAVLPDGQLFVAWEFIGVGANSTPVANIQARILNNAGVTTTPAVDIPNLANDGTPMDRANVAVNGQSEVLITWFTPNGIEGRIGSYESGEDASSWFSNSTATEPINTSAGDETSPPQSVGLDDGRFAIGWSKREIQNTDKIILRALRPKATEP